ncbi:MAG: polyprenyl synthetase family protein [Alphaproteobacteria bacterium]|nr:polyprenyl synthetase family protein [Alphaproteobacteria bacterium]
MNNLTNNFISIRQELNHKLDIALPLPNDLTKRVVEAMKYASIGTGKALRPFFVLSIGKILGCLETDLWTIACSLEMMHTYSLIHDDLPAMDNDVLRRGKPTTHIQFDEATAILAGDALLTKSFELLTNPKWDISAKTKCQLVQMLAKYAGTQGMIGGQMIDILGEQTRLTENQIRQMQTLKTGALLEYACISPCILSQSSQEVFLSLKKYASHIGLLFQITDDLLDALGDAEIVGKTLHKDKQAHKTTFITLYGIEKVKEMAYDHTKQAIQSIDIFGKEGNILKDVAYMILERNK